MPIDYNKYTLNKKEWCMLMIKGIGICSLVGALFYQSILGIFLVCPYLMIYMQHERKERLNERKLRLMVGFRDGIQCILAALESGYSMENAIKEAMSDLALMYDQKSEIQIEFLYMYRLIKNNLPIEQAMEQFAKRSGIEDVENFAEILKIAKRTGGDMIQIIRTTSRAIHSKIEVMREIQTLITAKKYEVKILKIIPFLIILYLWFFSPGFLSPLYHNAFGIVFMSVLLVLYLLMCKLAEHITNIQI